MEKMKRISKHISYDEATRTRVKIDNTPNAEQLKNMIRLAEKVFEPLRKWAGEPIRVNSFFRSVGVNAGVGGSKTSQHVALNGSAIDIDAMGEKTNAELFHYILENLEFDQLIWEYGNELNPDWVHVSLKKSGNRKQALKVIRIDGRNKYLPF